MPRSNAEFYQMILLSRGGTYSLSRSGGDGPKDAAQSWAALLSIIPLLIRADLSGN